MKKSLKDRLLRYLQNRPGIWIPKGKLADLARAKTGATGEYTGRTLRLLAEDGILEVRYIKHCAQYRYVKGTLTQKEQVVEIKDGHAIISYKDVPV